MSAAGRLGGFDEEFKRIKEETTKKQNSEDKKELTGPAYEPTTIVPIKLPRTEEIEVVPARNPDPGKPVNVNKYNVERIYGKKLNGAIYGPTREELKAGPAYETTTDLPEISDIEVEVEEPIEKSQLVDKVRQFMGGVKRRVTDGLDGLKQLYSTEDSKVEVRQTLAAIEKARNKIISKDKKLSNNRYDSPSAEKYRRIRSIREKENGSLSSDSCIVDGRDSSRRWLLKKKLGIEK